MNCFLSNWIVGAAVVIVALCSTDAGPATSKVEISVVDAAAQKPVPCRIHLKDAKGTALKADGLPFWHDHFVCPGTVRLELAPGTYGYEIERGPEWQRRSGSFTVPQDTRITVEMKRLADMKAEGWWCGELHVHRPVDDMQLLMLAEDLHVAPVITWWNSRNQWGGQKRLPDDPLVRFDANRYYHVMAGEDEREGGALLYLNLRRPLAIADAAREYPSPMKFLLLAALDGDVIIDLEKPFWWDVPVWLASGKVSTIGLANNHMNRGRMYETEAWGKPRDPKRLPPPLGTAHWTQEIYYHVLNSGLRIPPSAGSASGVLPNPVGYNRVYVHTNGEFNYQSWCKGLLAGRSFVTNGPLVRVTVNGKLPGHVFTAKGNDDIELDIRADVTTQDPAHAVEIVKNGKVEQSIPFTEFTKHGSRAKVKFTESGWMLVRVMCENAKTFRFASTAPYYVEIGPQAKRISRASVSFFLDWLDEREKRVKLDDPAQRREVLAHFETARAFWRKLLVSANAD